MIAWHHPFLILTKARGPSKVLGHSVGEYAAAVVAGVPLAGTLGIETGGMMLKMLRMFVNGNDDIQNISIEVHNRQFGIHVFLGGCVSEH